MGKTSENTGVFHPARLSRRGPLTFDLVPTEAERAALADELDILDIPELRLSGTLRPMGREDWELDGTLEAEVVQPCVVTLDPVRTRISEPVGRRYVAHMTEPEGPEIEMPEDDTVERLGSQIDARAVMAEALALALPLYPRARHAVPPAGDAPDAASEDERTRPFAGLADLLRSTGKDG